MKHQKAVTCIRSTTRISSVETYIRKTRRCRLFTSLERSEEHTSELQSRLHLVCRLLLEKKKTGLAHACLRGQARDGSDAPSPANSLGDHPFGRVSEVVDDLVATVRLSSNLQESRL